MRKRRNVLISNLFVMAFIFLAMCNEYVQAKIPRQRPSIIFGKTDGRTRT